MSEIRTDRDDWTENDTPDLAALMTRIAAAAEQIAAALETLVHFAETDASPDPRASSAP